MDKIKIIFFGTPDIGLKTLDYLNLSEKFEVLAVVTQPDKPSGRGQNIKPSPIKVYALNNGIAVFQPKSIRKEPDIIDSLKKLNPDFFVTYAFGQILSQEVLDIPKYATINVHVSLLPKYRGANPIQRAIINGDKVTGICTMITELGLDCGDICLQEKIDIPDDMNCEQLFEICAEKSPKLLVDTLIGLTDKTLIPKKQVEIGLCYADKITKEECLIDWNNSARSIHNLIRGVYNCPGAYFRYSDKIIKVMQSEVLDEDLPGNIGDFVRKSKEGIDVKTGDGILRLIMVKPEGKKTMLAKDWANGLH